MPVRENDDETEKYATDRLITELNTTDKIFEMTRIMKKADPHPCESALNSVCDLGNSGEATLNPVTPVK